MRFAAALFVAFACSGAFASDPGSHLDCSDWVLLQPGLSCRELLPIDCSADPRCTKGVPSQADNVGNVFRIRQRQIGFCGAYAQNRVELLAFNEATSSDTVIAYLDDRCGAHVYDFAQVFANESLTFDDMTGRLMFSLSYNCHPDTLATCTYPTDSWVADRLIIAGFATTFEVLQTYTPSAALGFRVPYMPEGMGGADHFDTYWGNLAHPIDFTQVHPLQCGYPAAPPHVGDYLTVADTIPTPEPGQGVYYVTATTYQGATRYGRKQTAGHMNGRDPAALPACVP
jgi:hypothetical protein